MENRTIGTGRQVVVPAKFQTTNQLFPKRNIFDKTNKHQEGRPRTLSNGGSFPPINIRGLGAAGHSGDFEFYVRTGTLLLAMDDLAVGVEPERSQLLYLIHAHLASWAADYFWDTGLVSATLTDHVSDELVLLAFVGIGRTFVPRSGVASKIQKAMAVSGVGDSKNDS